MNTTAARSLAAVLLVAPAGVFLAEPSAEAQQAQRPAIAAAGSPIVVPASYVEGTLGRWDARAGVIVVDGTTYPVLNATVVDNLAVGERVVVTVLVEHHGPAARKIALGVVRAGN
jgi:hypothetical protein